MRKEVTLCCAVLLMVGSLVSAGEQRPYVGVRLDATPLPDLLTKHLRLDPGQGLRISNVMTGSPADQAGLERDDIVFALDGQKISTMEQFIEVVGKVGIGNTITLDVIHLGERRTVKAKLGPVPQNLQWKYADEPDIVTSWRPGKFWQIGPDGKRIEVSPDKIPALGLDLKSILRQSYTYEHKIGDENYTITIEGDPADDDSRLILEDKDGKHNATVGAIDSLPEKYRAAAKQTVADARNNRTSIRIQGFQVPQPDANRQAEEKDIAIEKLQSQIERLRQQMKEIEELNRQMLDKTLRKNETNKSSNPPSRTSEPSEPKQKQAI